MNRKTRILVSSVVAVHLFFFFFDFKEKHSPPSPKKSIVVNTYIPPPPIQKPVVKAIPKRSIPTHKNTHKNEILNELKESLSKIETTAPPESSLSLPKKIQSLQIDHADKKEETDYLVSLAYALKESLELPEHGDVKLELTVSHTGRVLKLRILQALSEKNRRYLELNLPQMSLPPFNEDLKNENAHTFTLTFCNAT
jgi:hypothetical protein